MLNEIICQFIVPKKHLLLDFGTTQYGTPYLRRAEIVLDKG